VIGRIAAAVGIVAGALLVAAAIGAIAFLLGPLPSHRGRVDIPGLSASVAARFDRRGIPHVRAVLEVDAWRAMGFIHAADRLFQMELRRRAASGRLAEIIGHAALAMDREARLNGYTTLARRDWELLSENERGALTAYADGVNAFLADHALPLELRALRVVPEPWTPVDSLAFGRLMQDDLSLAAAVERGALDDARARGVDAAIALLDASEPGSSIVDPEIADLLVGRRRTASIARSADEMAPAGSNAWALAGKRTASGKPLLAGDPHLAAERPGIWYAAHVESADGLDAIGLTLAGVPGILIGHNGRVAWTLTMHQADDSDLFVEQVDWAAGTYRRRDSWVPIDRATETIRVKGEADVVLAVDRTVHGPIVLRLEDLPGIAIARAFAPAILAQGPGPFLLAARARTGAELLDAWTHYAGPSVNVCWADATGAIGVKVAGAIPRRLAGNGRFPVPGWTGNYDWDGVFAADSLPAITAPEQGLVATANDDWSVSGERLPYPGLFADADRVTRAREMGSALATATVADMRVMQTDVYSPYAARIVAALRRLKPTDPRAARALSVLSSWQARAEALGPSRLFYAFMKAVRRQAGPPSLRVTWSMLERMIDGSGAQSYWDDPGTPQVEAREGRIEKALAEALETVERAEGADPKRWSFGASHQLVYEHPFASVLPLPIARRLAIGPVALPGEWHTLDVAGFSLRGDRHDVTHIPSARLIVDLADPDASRLVLPLGQSGQLFDRHVKDQLRAWSTGHDFPLPFTAKAVEAATISTLQFVPGD
jgi:penicillin amidase